MANKTVKLPSGATAELKDPAMVKQGDRRKVFSVIKTDDNSVAATVEVSYAVIALMVESWSFDLLPPSVNVDSLDELSIPDYDVLQDEATVFMQALFPQLNKTVETEADPKALTVESND